MTHRLLKCLHIDDSTDRITMLYNIQRAQKDNKVTSLYINDVLIDTVICSALIGLLQQRHLWKTVVFCQTRGQIGRIIEKIMELDNVERLRISVDQSIRESIVQIGNGLKRSHVLSELKIYTHTLDLPSTIALGKGIANNKSLKDFGFCLSKHQSKLILAIGWYVSQNSTLSTARFDGCCLDDYNLATLVYIIRQNCTLKDLSLERNNCGTKTIQQISKLLKTCALRKLRLNHQYITPGNRLDLSSLCHALAENPYLKSLNLQGNQLDDVHFQDLVDALCSNQNLSELRLDSNWITDEGISHLEQCSSHMLGLRGLGLECNLITTIGAYSIQNTVCQGGYLEKVKIPTQNIDMETAQQDINFHGECNRVVNKLFKKRGIPREQWSTLKQRANVLLHSQTSSSIPILHIDVFPKYNLDSSFHFDLQKNIKQAYGL